MAGSRWSFQGPTVRSPSGLTAFTVAATFSSTGSLSFSHVTSVVTWPWTCPVTSTFKVSPWACAAGAAVRARARAVRAVTAGRAARWRMVGCLRWGGAAGAAAYGGGG
ncbi:hypothetical protein BLA24_13125 [Streptomyces cinnamoneus]|uniref:Uncharacterized protein n=1 Tax=Streptomyces cinnamoneus TaxID=53446 RepID=A0A2G1XK80_STRCJ|nr:hypothetical protein BLA24_13125 [Streptomyces cinnamoneus]